MPASPTPRSGSSRPSSPRWKNAEAAQCFASGMAASHALLAGRLSAGDHLVISDTNYVGTAELVRDSLPRWGIAVTPVDTSDAAATAAAIRPETKMLWIETPANPIMRLSDIAELSALAHGAGVRDVVVDSTFATPVATRPLELGADFVVHSLTKYIGGHGDAMGGAVIGRRPTSTPSTSRPPCITAACCRRSTPG
jgi:cystathionine beta-lyase/cystathionine gamma-synthase